MTKIHEWVSPVTMALRDLDEPGLQGGRELGRAVLRALGFTDGFTHMEWYRKADGEVVFGEIGARPPGARTVDVMNYATDADLFAGWAHAVTHGSIPFPVERHYNAASIFKRAQGPAGSPATRAWTGCWPSTATTSPRSTCSRWARRGATGGPP